MCSLFLVLLIIVFLSYIKHSPKHYWHNFFKTVFLQLIFNFLCIYLKFLILLKTCIYLRRNAILFERTFRLEKENFIFIEF
jgi:hypothetical protein